ncbi:MAG: thiol:disulfide interchange protein DsbD [Planctomycetota bacterium]
MIGYGGISLAQEQELLPPEQAFALSAWMDNGDLVAEYRIAPGYYMYRERFAFEFASDTGGAEFGPPIFPKGKIKNDEFFGDMEVYRNSVRIILPIETGDSLARQLRVKATSQGCADIGVCYPPLRQALNINLDSKAVIQPADWNPDDNSVTNSTEDVATLQSLLSSITGKPASTQTSTNSENRSALQMLQTLGEDSGLDNSDEILHPDEAFILTARLDANNVIQTNILMAANIYLYLDKFKVAMVSGKGHDIGAIALPKGKKKDDPFLGPTEVIYDQVDISIPIMSSAGASDKFVLSYQYQGCVEDRICYPPVTKYLNVDAGAGLIQVVNTPPDGINTAAIDTRNLTSDNNPPLSEQDQFTRFLHDQSLLIVIGIFFLAGIGLTFTPCVFPMIPILSSIIAGQGDSITTRKAFSLSLVYVLAMASTYAVIGAIAGYFGNEFNIQIWFQDPVILSIFAAVFVLLALSMFGFYELQLPNALQSRLASLSNSQQGGDMIGVGLMGFFSAIIVGPCITAPLVGALFYITQTQDWQLGGLALFALGMGMGVPLLLIGTSAGSLLPRAGGWMDAVKSVFGVVLLAVAIWLLERFLPVGITMLLVAALLIGSSIYMGALDTITASTSGWRRFSKGAGILVLIYGITYLLGVAAGSHDLIQPLRGLGSFTQQGNSREQRVNFRQIKGTDGLQLALDDSLKQGRLTMLDFYADWCISCKEMEKYAFTHPGVLNALKGVATLQADVTENDAIDSALMSSLGIYGPPAILFYDANGQEVRHRRVVGEMSGEEFAAHIIKTYQ